MAILLNSEPGPYYFHATPGLGTFAAPGILQGSSYTAPFTTKNWQEIETTLLETLPQAKLGPPPETSKEEQTVPTQPTPDIWGPMMMMMMMGGFGTQNNTGRTKKKKTTKRTYAYEGGPMVEEITEE